MRAVLEIARPGLIENSQSDCLFGNLNSDLTINVLDIIITVNIILNIEESNDCADINADGTINILDIVLIANLILD